MTISKNVNSCHVKLSSLASNDLVSSINPSFEGVANESALSHTHNLGASQEYLTKARALAPSYVTVQAILLFGRKTREMSD